MPNFPVNPIGTNDSLTPVFEIDFFSAGSQNYLSGANVIDVEHFGARYISLRDEERFFDQMSDFDGGLLLWPGGSVAERLLDRYGMEYEGLFNEDHQSDRPNLLEMMSYANEQEASLSIILPTARYQNNEEQLRDDIWNFFESLLLDIGNDQLPHRLIIEIGNEFYANFDGANDLEKAISYGKIANVFGEELAKIDAAFGGLPENIEFSFQAGRDAESNQSIIQQLSEESLSFVDMVSHHRFAPRVEAVGKSVDELKVSLGQWAEATSGITDEDPELYLSAYNVASLGISESMQDFVQNCSEKPYDDHFVNGELEVCDQHEFREFYQNQLDARPIGIRHAELLLETYTEYSELGISAAGVYGWDLVHGGRSSLQGTDGKPYVFAAGSIQDMMAESLPGTTPLNWHLQGEKNLDSDRNEEATELYGFEGTDKLVVFVSNPNVDNEFDLHLDLGTLGVNIEQVWVEKLTAETPDNWQELFNVEVWSDVDQSAQAESYGVGVREVLEPEILDGKLVLPVQSDQIIRLSIAKTPAGVEEIQSWHQGNGLALEETNETGFDADVAALFLPSSQETHYPALEAEEDQEPDGEDDSNDDGFSFSLESILTSLILAMFGIFI